MNAIATPVALTITLEALTDFLRDSGSDLSPAEAIAASVSTWLAVARADAHRGPARSARGYQWKCLFLPDTTELRMRGGDTMHHARVVGDDIVFNGESVSPRQMSIAIAGEGRNAWRDMWVRLPGDARWRTANYLRHEVIKEGKPAPASPVATMQAAAVCMSDALKTALTLVEHANAQAVRKYERRVARHRREADYMVDACMAD